MENERHPRPPNPGVITSRTFTDAWCVLKNWTALHLAQSSDLGTMLLCEQTLLQKSIFMCASLVFRTVSGQKTSYRRLIVAGICHFTKMSTSFCAKWARLFKKTETKFMIIVILFCVKIQGLSLSGNSETIDEIKHGLGVGFLTICEPLCHFLR